MSDIAADYELQADRLCRLLKAKKTFEPAMELALDLHAVTHTGVVSGSSSPTFCDQRIYKKRCRTFSERIIFSIKKQKKCGLRRS